MSLEVANLRRIVLVLGGGGVGKTTTSAAVALKLATSGKRVVVVTVDPARRLASALGIGALQSNEQEVVLPVESSGSLFASMLNQRQMFDGIVRRHLADDASTKLLEHPLYQHLSASLAGVQEYMAVEKLVSLVQNPDWDHIVLDTPPASNALEFLDAPQRFVASLTSTPMRLLARGTKELRSQLGKGASIALSAISKITGGDFLSSLADLVAGLSGLFDGFQERAKLADRMLRSDAACALLVTAPTKASLDEAEMLRIALGQRGITIAGSVINNILMAAPSDKSLPAVMTDADAESRWDGLWNYHHAQVSMQQRVLSEKPAFAQATLMPRLTESVTNTRRLLELADSILTA